MYLSDGDQSGESDLQTVDVLPGRQRVDPEVGGDSAHPIVSTNTPDLCVLTPTLPGCAGTGSPAEPVASWLTSGWLWLGVGLVALVLVRRR